MFPSIVKEIIRSYAREVTTSSTDGGIPEHEIFPYPHSATCHISKDPKGEFYIYIDDEYLGVPWSHRIPDKKCECLPNRWISPNDEWLVKLSNDLESIGIYHHESNNPVKTISTDGMSPCTSKA